MTDFLSDSPLLILLALGIISWFTGCKPVKVATLLFFFGYPLMQGKTAMPGFDVSQIIDFVVSTVSYWLNEALNSLIEYIKAKLALV